MAQTQSSNPAPVTEAAFLADRQKMFAGFGNFTLGAVIFLTILMLLMLVFLV